MPTVVQLKVELRKLGKPITGNKNELEVRLANAQDEIERSLPTASPTASPSAAVQRSVHTAAGSNPAADLSLVLDSEGHAADALTKTATDLDDMDSSDPRRGPQPDTPASRPGTPAAAAGVPDNRRLAEQLAESMRVDTAQRQGRGQTRRWSQLIRMTHEDISPTVEEMGRAAQLRWYNDYAYNQKAEESGSLSPHRRPNTKMVNLLHVQEAFEEVVSPRPHPSPFGRPKRSPE
jgi:hypothetical protein